MADIPTQAENEYWCESKKSERRRSSNANIVNLMTVVLEALHETFKDGRITGRLLDIGCGATIHTYISASNNVQEIYISNCQQQNIDFIKKWLKGENRIQESLVREVCKLEDKNQSTEERVNQIKNKVKSVEFVDMISLFESLKNNSMPTSYNVITSCFTIDMVTNNKEQYIRCLSNIATLLTPGGYLITVGGLNSELQSQNINNNNKGANLSSEELYAIYDEAGFDIEDFRQFSCFSPVHEQSATFFILAKKIG